MEGWGLMDCHATGKSTEVEVHLLPRGVERDDGDSGGKIENNYVKQQSGAAFAVPLYTVL